MSASQGETREIDPRDTGPDAEPDDLSFLRIGEDLRAHEESHRVDVLAV